MEPVGLALGVLGVSGLFVSCIQNFNIIVQYKSFGEDFDFLCARLATLRLRLQTWGEAMGIVSGPDEIHLPPSVYLDRSDVIFTFRGILLHLCRLLEEAGGMTDRYTIVDEASPGAGGNTGLLHSSKSMDIFQEAFDDFKARLKRSKKHTSKWKLMRWTVQDLNKFEDIIGKISSLMDDLEKTTCALDKNITHRQNAMMTQEVESVSDTRSLRLLQDLALSTHASSSSSQRLISDAASTHLTHIMKSNLSGSSQSYNTAPTHPGSSISGSSDHREIIRRTFARAAVASNSRAWQDIADLQEDTSEQKIPETATQSLQPEIQRAQVSQNRLIMDQALKKQHVPTPCLSFASGSTSYGQAITAVRETHEKKWETASRSLIVQADNGNELARRIFIELRSIRRAQIPFISATPLDDRLDIIVASIEGPPDTPYEKGIFWLLVRFDPDAPTKPPHIRFLTRVYHPNIDCEGKVCAHYPELTNTPVSSTAKGSKGKQPETLSWFAGESPARFYLGAFLTALCSLLASPTVDDPLVVEIAETYVTDHAAFVRNARHYTQKYATKGRPEADAISSCISAWDVPLESGGSLARLRSTRVGASQAAASTLLQDSDTATLEASTRADHASISSEIAIEESWPDEFDNHFDEDEDPANLDPDVRRAQVFQHISARKKELQEERNNEILSGSWKYLEEHHKEISDKYREDIAKCPKEGWDQWLKDSSESWFESGAEDANWGRASPLSIIGGLSWDQWSKDDSEPWLELGPKDANRGRVRPLGVIGEMNGDLLWDPWANHYTESWAESVFKSRGQ